MAILSNSEPMSWRSRSAMASRSPLVTMRMASESAMPATNDQVSRRLTASPYDSVRLGAGAPGGQGAHDLRTLGVAHRAPARDLVEGAPATNAEPRSRIDGADVGAGAFR